MSDQSNLTAPLAPRLAAKLARAKGIELASFVEPTTKYRNEVAAYSHARWPDPTKLTRREHAIYAEWKSGKGWACVAADNRMSTDDVRAIIRKAEGSCDE